MTNARKKKKMLYRHSNAVIWRQQGSVTEVVIEYALPYNAEGMPVYVPMQVKKMTEMKCFSSSISNRNFAENKSTSPDLNL